MSLRDNVCVALTLSVGFLGKGSDMLFIRAATGWNKLTKPVSMSEELG